MAYRSAINSKPDSPINRGIIVLLGALVLAAGGLFTWIELRAARTLMHDSMMVQALMLTASFDVDKIADLTGTTEDLSSPGYHYLRDQLIRIRNTNSRYRYLYFFGRREGRPPFFFMGTAPEDSTDYSPPGQVYYEDSPTLNQVFATRRPGISPPFTDRWGTWVSALVPILDPSNGNVLAVFGMDVHAEDWQSEILRRAMMPAVITCLIIFLMGAGAGYLRRRQLAGHIQELRQAQDALRESEALFRLQFELGNIGIAITSTEKGWVRANARLCEMLGYTEKELRQKTWSEMTHPDDLAEDLDHFHQMLAGRIEGYAMDKRFIRKDGRLVNTHLTVSCHRQPDRTVQFVIASLQDISERKKAESALRESERKYRLIAENAADVIFTMDMDFRTTYISPSVQKVRGYSADEAMAQSIDQTLTPDSLQKAYSAIEKASEYIQQGDLGRQLTLELEQYRKDGSTFWTENELSFLIDESGKAAGIVGVTRDISERKRAEADRARLGAQLLQAQKMEAVGQLAGGIAHDFNNMLSVVIGHTEMAMAGLDSDDVLHRRLRTIHETARRSTDLVRQLLAFARKQTVSPKVLDINHAISGMLTMLRRLIGEDIDLKWRPGTGLGKVRIDPSQIDQILANLMVNARDAITGVGKITIETDNVTIDEAYCAGKADFVPGPYVLLVVSDNGCGMDEKTLSQIFDPFFTTKTVSQGTGLGLATVYGIMKQNKGTISVYSEPGQGTTFRLYLPAVDAPEDAVEETGRVEAAAPGTGTGTILIVEDEAAILELAQTILARLGYTVLAAGTPDEALALAREDPGRIDLLITDVVMPQMSGLELMQRLKEIIPGLRCLYMSGYTSNVIVHHGVLAPGVHFLQKPFSVREIASRVAEAIRS